MVKVIGHHTGNKNTAIVSAVESDRYHLRVGATNPDITQSQLTSFSHNFTNEPPGIINRAYVRNQFYNNNAEFLAIPLCALFSVCEFIKIYNNNDLMLDIVDKMGKIYYHRHYLNYENEGSFMADRSGHTGLLTSPTLSSSTTIYSANTTSDYYSNDLDYVFGTFFRGLDTRFLKNLRVEIQMIATTSRNLDSFYFGLDVAPATITLAQLTIKNLSLNFDITRYPTNSPYFLGNKISIPSFKLHRKQYPVTSQAETSVSISLNQDFPVGKSINALYFYLSKTTPTDHVSNFTVFENHGIIKTFELLKHNNRVLYLESPLEVQYYCSQYFKQKNLKRTETNFSNSNANAYTMGLKIPLHHDINSTGESVDHFSTKSNVDNTYTINLVCDTVGHNAAFDILNVVCEFGTIINLSHSKGYENTIM